jgi:hypothetical protein
MYHAPCVLPPDPRTARPVFALRRQTQRPGQAPREKVCSGVSPDYDDASYPLAEEAKRNG